MERFYDPNCGQILIDEIDMKEYDIEWLHNKMGYVQQEPVLLSGTILFNITYGLREYAEE